MTKRRKRRNRNQKYYIRNIILAVCLLCMLSGAAYLHFGGSDARENVQKFRTELLERTQEAGEKTGFAGAAARVNDFFQEIWNVIVPAEERNIQLEDIPVYAGSPFIEVNNNLPEFDEADMSGKSFERYSSLDYYGRCGVAYANIGRELMPLEERESISDVTPSGWVNKKYEGIDGEYLYNRCHLIGYQLAGENANEKNLITGTRYLNVDGMLPLENKVTAYVRETGNHVLYRVTPIFEGRNLVASGVQMEAKSVEDNGAGVQFNVYCYNVQPGIVIDYATGESSAGQ